MKTPRIANAIGQIDDDLGRRRSQVQDENKKHWLIWVFGSMLCSACNCRGGNPPIAISKM